MSFKKKKVTHSTTFISQPHHSYSTVRLYVVENFSGEVLLSVLFLRFWRGVSYKEMDGWRRFLDGEGWKTRKGRPKWKTRKGRPKSSPGQSSLVFLRLNPNLKFSIGFEIGTWKTCLWKIISFGMEHEVIGWRRKKMEQKNFVKEREL